MDQLLAMQHDQYGQELTQQQQHLASTEDQLTVAAGSQQLAVGAAPLPFAHQPKSPFHLNRRPKAGYLGMEHPLQTGPKLADPLLVPLRCDPAQYHRGLRCQAVRAEPKAPLGPWGFRKEPFEAITAADE